MSLIDAALNRSHTVIASLVLLLIAGFIAYRDIPKESDPDINIPIVYVALSHGGQLLFHLMMPALASAPRSSSPTEPRTSREWPSVFGVPQDDHSPARSPDPPLRDHRDRQRELALQEPLLTRHRPCLRPACPGGSTPYLPRGFADVRHRKVDLHRSRTGPP